MASEKKGLVDLLSTKAYDELLHLVIEECEKEVSKPYSHRARFNLWKLLSLELGEFDFSIHGKIKAYMEKNIPVTDFSPVKVIKSALKLNSHEARRIIKSETLDKADTLIADFKKQFP